jgi:hypothetical protein
VLEMKLWSRLDAHFPSPKDRLNYRTPRSPVRDKLTVASLLTYSQLFMQPDSSSSVHRSLTYIAILSQTNQIHTLTFKHRHLKL